ncbi:MAG: hypothetical protein ACRD20_13970 [Terriglobales bacterium]
MRVVEMSKILLLIVSVSLTGCLHERSAGFVVPAHYVRVNVQSFTRPCVQLVDGKIVCDGVVITASCLQAPPIAAPALP